MRPYGERPARYVWANLREREWRRLNKTDRRECEFVSRRVLRRKAREDGKREVSLVLNAQDNQ